MSKVVVVEGGRQIPLKELRKRRLNRPGAEKVHEAPLPPTYRHPAAVSLRIATERLAEHARNVVGTDPTDSSFRMIRDGLDDSASKVRFAEARIQVRRAYRRAEDNKIIRNTLKNAKGIDDTERGAITRILLSIGRPTRSRSLSPSKN